MNAPPTPDPVLRDDWHPVAMSAALEPGAITSAKLLGMELALWRGSDGVVHAWEDRCPHRGTRLSVGRFVGDGIVCAYHGWRFEADGEGASRVTWEYAIHERGLGGRLLGPLVARHFQRAMQTCLDNISRAALAG